MSTSTANLYVQEAQRLRDLDIAIVWLEPGERMPKRYDWTHQSQTPAEYTPGKNLGTMTGAISGNLIGVDCDHLEAARVLRAKLPETLTDGRASKPQTHFWFRVYAEIPDWMVSESNTAKALGVERAPRGFSFSKPGAGKGREIVSLRGTGSLLTCPPSIVSNEERAWSNFREPAVMSYEELYNIVAEVAGMFGWSPSTARVQERRVRDDLNKVVARSGGGGRRQTWRAVRVCINDFLYTPEETLELLREWNAQQEPPWSESELWDHILRALEAPEDPCFPQGSKTVPDVQVSRGRETASVNMAIDAMRYRDGVFQRGGELVRVIYADDGEPIVRPMAYENVRMALADSARWLQYDPDKSRQKVITVPEWLVSDVLKVGCWPGVPYLKGVVSYPVLRPDGSILHEEGYDDRMKLYSVPSECPIRLPRAEPTLEDAKEATERLLHGTHPADHVIDV